MRIPLTAVATSALLLITMIWGSTFTVVKQSLSQVSPILFVALRFWIAAAVIFVCLPGSFRGFSPTVLRHGLVLAFALVSGFVFQTLGLRLTSPSRSAFITSLSVLLVPVLGLLLFHHRPRKQTVLGVAMAVVGLGLLTLDAARMKFRAGDLLTLLCAAAFAFHVLFLGRYVQLGDYRALVVLQVAGGAVLSTALLPVFETPYMAWDTRLAFSLLLTGVLATALAFYVQNWAQQYTTANRAALIFSLEPFFAALTAYLATGETLSRKEWIGGILVLAGVLTSEMRQAASKDALQRRNSPRNDPYQMRE
jgi:drug/metabolite transporter (DMT)-like permease